MKNHSESAAQSPEQLLNDLHALVAEAEKMLAGSLSEQADDAVGALRARYDAAQERLGELYAGAKTRLAAGAKCTDEAIRSHPYESIAIAAGVGLLLGVLLGRRGH